MEVNEDEIDDDSDHPAVDEQEEEEEEEEVPPAKRRREPDTPRQHIPAQTVLWEAGQPCEAMYSGDKNYVIHSNAVIIIHSHHSSCASTKLWSKQ